MPLRLELPKGTSAWHWAKLLRCMVEPVGLPVGVTDPELAADNIQEAPLERDDVELHKSADKFIPHGRLRHRLPGRVHVAAPLTMQGGKGLSVPRVRLGVVADAGSVYVTEAKSEKGTVRAYDMQLMCRCQKKATARDMHFTIALPSAMQVDCHGTHPGATKVTTDGIHQRFASQTETSPSRGSRIRSAWPRV